MAGSFSIQPSYVAYRLTPRYLLFKLELTSSKIASDNMYNDFCEPRGKVDARIAGGCWVASSLNQSV